MDCADEVKYEVMNQVVEDLVSEFGEAVNTINGARVQFPDGWGFGAPVGPISRNSSWSLRARRKRRCVVSKRCFRARLTKYRNIGTTWHNE